MNEKTYWRKIQQANFVNEDVKWDSFLYSFELFCYSIAAQWFICSFVFNTNVSEFE